MTYDLEKLNALIAHIYDAALDDAQWPSLIHKLARLVNAEDSILKWFPITVQPESRIKLCYRWLIKPRQPDELLDIDNKPRWEFDYQDLDGNVPDCTS